MKKIIFYISFFIITMTLFANTLDDKQKQINKINSEIKKKGEEIKKNTEKIKTIEKKTETLKEQITRVERELKAIEKDKQDLHDKIRVVNRKIDYGQRNLKFSSKELTNLENEYLMLLQTWQKNSSANNEDIHNFKEILNSNKSRQEDIKLVQQDIKEVKANIEKEQRNLRNLESQLAKKEREQENKKKQHKNLIAQYNREKKETSIKTAKAKSSIGSLQKQKAEIEKEIDKIIRTRTKQLGNVAYSTVAKNLGSFRRPISGKIIVKFNQKKTGGIKSTGQEISGKLGDRVLAANKGTVIFAGKFMNLGNVVMINHGYNLITIYGNLIGIDVKLNQKVNKGTPIGVLGLDFNGKSYLYYETRFNLKPSDPSLF